jgi:hypothetical protein
MPFQKCVYVDAPRYQGLFWNVFSNFFSFRERRELDRCGRYCFYERGSDENDRSIPGWSRYFRNQRLPPSTLTKYSSRSTTSCVISIFIDISSANPRDPCYYWFIIVPVSRSVGHVLKSCDDRRDSESRVSSSRTPSLPRQDTYFSSIVPYFPSFSSTQTLCQRVPDLQSEKSLGDR